jgi:CBS domain-containing protein
MAIMSAKRVRHLPVINDGELLGIVSIGDLVKSIIGVAIRTPSFRAFIKGYPC